MLDFVLKKLFGKQNGLLAYAYVIGHVYVLLHMYAYDMNCFMAFKEFSFNAPSTFHIWMQIICREHTKESLPMEMREKSYFEIPSPL